jgi:hypothetical protein
MSPNLGQHPLFLEDEDIFQKSDSVVQILQQFPIKYCTTEADF